MECVSDKEIRKYFYDYVKKSITQLLSVLNSVIAAAYLHEIFFTIIKIFSGDITREYGLVCRSVLLLHPDHLGRAGSSRGGCS